MDHQEYGDNAGDSTKQGDAQQDQPKSKDIMIRFYLKDFYVLYITVYYYINEVIINAWMPLNATRMKINITHVKNE